MHTLWARRYDVDHRRVAKVGIRYAALIVHTATRRPGTAGFVAVNHVQHTDPRDVREDP